MSDNFQGQHAASVARIMAGTEVLAARVTLNDEVLIVHANQVGQAMLMLHGDPVPGMTVVPKVEYVAMSVADFAALPDWQ